MCEGILLVLITGDDNGIWQVGLKDFQCPIVPRKCHKVTVLAKMPIALQQYQIIYTPTQKWNLNNSTWKYKCVLRHKFMGCTNKRL